MRRILLALCLAACAPRVDVAGPRPFEDDLEAFGDDDSGDGASPGDDDGDDDDDDDGAAPAPGAPAVVGVREGVIARPALDAVLAAGIPTFLRGFEVTRHLGPRGEFVGWKIVQFLPSDRYAGIDLQPGDIIGEVNGRMISRPNHLQELWDTLPTATQLSIRVIRVGVPFDLRFAVAAEPVAAAPVVSSAGPH